MAYIIKYVWAIATVKILLINFHNRKVLEGDLFITEEWETANVMLAQVTQPFTRRNWHYSIDSHLEALDPGNNMNLAQE